MEGSEGTVAERTLVTCRIICAAMAGSVIVYLAVGYFLVEVQSIPPIGALPEIGIWLLAAAALAPLGIAGFVEKMVYRAKETDSAIPSAEAFQQAVIVGFVLREGTAVIGLILTLMTASTVWVYGLGLIAFLSMLASWPTAARAERLWELGRGREVSPTRGY